MLIKKIVNGFGNITESCLSPNFGVDLLDGLRGDFYWRQTDDRRQLHIIIFADTVKHT